MRGYWKGWDGRYSGHAVSRIPVVTIRVPNGLIELILKEIPMADCECLGGCPFFNGKMKDSDGLASIFKNKYCLGDNKSCARYMVFKKLGKPSVPPNLYPNMKEQAMQILSRAG